MKEFDSKLENIFSRRRKQTEGSELPLGHMERFQQKIDRQNVTFWQKLSGWFNDNTAGRRIGWALAPAICILAAVLFLKKSDPDIYLQQMENGYRMSLIQMGNQLTEDSRMLSEGYQEDAMYSISSIIDDEQLMALQLPDNLSKKEKQQIIKEYYNQKMEGLKRIKTFIAMNNEESE